MIPFWISFEILGKCFHKIFYFHRMALEHGSCMKLYNSYSRQMCLKGLYQSPCPCDNELAVDFHHKGTCYVWSKNSTNQQLLDILAFTSANQIFKRWFISWIIGQNVQKVPIWGFRWFTFNGKLVYPRRDWGGSAWPGITRRSLDPNRQTPLFSNCTQLLNRWCGPICDDT